MYKIIGILMFSSVLTLLLISQFMAFPAPEVVSRLIKNQPINSVMYVSDVSGNNDIYTMDIETKHIENLTNNPSEDMNPQLSPDHKSVTFYSNRDGDNEIYLMDIGSREVRQLTVNKAEDYDPTFSPDGKNITYKSTEDDKLGDIFIMDRTGENKRNLTKTFSKTEEWDPIFDESGTHIYFVQRRDSDPFTDEIFVMDTIGDNKKKLTDNTVPDWYPSINPVNGSIAFISKVDSKSSDSIFTMENDGSMRKVVTSLPGNSADPAWNSTGTKIVFINDAEKEYDIYILDSKANTTKKIMNSDTDELSPIFFIESRAN